MGKLKIFDGTKHKGGIILEIILENKIISAGEIARKIRKKGYTIKGVNPKYEAAAIGIYISHYLLNKSVGKVSRRSRHTKAVTFYYPLKK